MKRIILMLAAILPMIAFAQSVLITESLRLIESSSADVQYANEFGDFKNPELDEPFPYAVIRMELEGNVQKAKQMLSLDMGTNFKVEARNIHKNNMILFLVRSSARSIYLQCGDGCEEQQLYYGNLIANKVYTCKVSYESADNATAGENSGALLAQMAEMQKQIEALQNQQGGNNNAGDNAGDADDGQNQVEQALKENNDVLPLVLYGVEFNMIKVEGGTFQMGADNGDSDENPVHFVTLNDYYIGETEVTQELWTEVMGNNPSCQKGDDLPVNNVSWTDCQSFVRKMNKLTGLQFALPTEAQWEYAARGGKKSCAYKYSGSNDINSVAWHTGNCSNQLHFVGMMQANELGIYDMSGNVCEWCQDWYGTYNSAHETNPTGPSSGSSRVLRGGSWFASDWYCRSSDRHRNSPDYIICYNGLRLVLIP